MGLKDVILIIVLMAVITIAESDRMSSILNPRMRRTAEKRDPNKPEIGVPATVEAAHGDASTLVDGDMYLTQGQFLSQYEPASPLELDEIDSTVAFHEESFTKGSKRMSNGVVQGSAGRTKRAVAGADLKRRWTNRTLVYVPMNETFKKWEHYSMERAMTAWERYTCIRFRKATPSDKAKISFVNAHRCYSEVGMTGGQQTIWVESKARCNTRGGYIHELGHAIGLHHEHARPDREGHIRFLKEIPATFAPQDLKNYSVPFDISSVMHYPGFGLPPMEAVNASEQMFLRNDYHQAVTYYDVWTVNLMYNCSEHCPDKNKCGTDGHLDENCNCICKDGSYDCDTTKKTPKDDTCVNKFFGWLCHVWADEGQCERNHFYMAKYCAKACGKCGSKPSSPGDCKDVYMLKCPQWKERGDCVTNKKWMSVNCPATCNMCGDPDNTPDVNCDNFINDSLRCETYAKEGDCVIYKDWMLANCRKSCRACTVQNINASLIGQIQEGKCVNAHPTEGCDKGARDGLCDKPGYEAWMDHYCTKSCKKCENAKCKNYLGAQHCPRDPIECLLKHSYMATNCMKTCGTGLCLGTDPDAANFIIV